MLLGSKYLDYISKYFYGCSTIKIKSGFIALGHKDSVMD